MRVLRAATGAYRSREHIVGQSGTQHWEKRSRNSTTLAFVFSYFRICVFSYCGAIDLSMQSLTSCVYCTIIENVGRACWCECVLPHQNIEQSVCNHHRERWSHFILHSSVGSCSTVCVVVVASMHGQVYSAKISDRGSWVFCVPKLHRRAPVHV